MDYVNYFLNLFNETIIIGTTSIQKTRPRIQCNDGFSVSIQASEFAYCSPRLNGLSVYTEVELGYPSEEDVLISKFGHEGGRIAHGHLPLTGPRELTSNIYSYVSVDIVNALIKKHGGLDEDYINTLIFMNL